MSVTAGMEWRLKEFTAGTGGEYSGILGSRFLLSKITRSSAVAEGLKVTQGHSK